MSAFLLGIGFRADMGTCVRKLVLLKLIDACDDDGTRIFPAIATIARAAQCSTRQVQRELQAFREIGLIRLVREGGKGPRSTNEYEMNLDMLHRLGRDGWEAVVGAKGDTESPLADADKGDSGDTPRVTLETDKGDTKSHTTPPDPSLDPSSEREARASERDEDGQPEDPKAVERAFWRCVKDWPGFAGMPKEPAKREWFALSPGERAEAGDKRDAWLAMLKAQRKSHTPAPSTYFREKLWMDVPEPEEEKPTVLDAKPFGPLWQVARMKQFVTGPKAALPDLTAYQRWALEEGLADEAQLRRDQLVKFGWPAVNAMHQRALDRRGVSVAPELERFCPLMEPVPVGSEAWEAWRLEHELRGWPWLPDPGGMPVVYFPRGGPSAGIAAFEAAVQGEDRNDDGGRREAAE